MHAQHNASARRSRVTMRPPRLQNRCPVLRVIAGATNLRAGKIGLELGVQCLAIRARVCRVRRAEQVRTVARRQRQCTMDACYALSFACSSVDGSGPDSRSTRTAGFTSEARSKYARSLAAGTQSDSRIAPLVHTSIASRNAGSGGDPDSHCASATWVTCNCAAAARTERPNDSRKARRRVPVSCDMRSQ